MDRRRLFFAVNFVLGLAGLCWLLFRFGRGALALLAGGGAPLPLAGFAAAVLAALVAAGVRWRLLLGALGLAPPLVRLCAFRAASQSVSLMLPGGRLGGEPLRIWCAVRDRVPVPAAIASVAVDRVLEIALGLGFAGAFAVVLMQANVPGIAHALRGMLAGATALAIAIGVALWRLRRGGLVGPLVRRLTPATARYGEVAVASEDAAARLLGHPRPLARALAVGLLADLLTLVQYKCLLAAFDLPSTPLAVVAAAFASGAARTLPVPGSVGAVEAAQLWLFGLLGHPPEVGMAVGLVTRLRDVVWAAPGFAFLLGRALRGERDAPALDAVEPR